MFAVLNACENAEVRVRQKLYVYTVTNDAAIAKLKAENEVLRNLVSERSKDLFEALSALSDMWNQYCPPPRTHLNMSAGEAAEEVLTKWQLMRADETSIYIGGMVIDDDVPDIVLELRTNPA